MANGSRQDYELETNSAWRSWRRQHGDPGPSKPSAEPKLDGKSKEDESDSSRVAGDERYQVDYFAKEAGISFNQAQQLVQKHGNDRDRLMAEAARLSPKRSSS